MSVMNNDLAKHIGPGLTYEGAAMHVLKRLPFGDPMSTKQFRHEQGDGNYNRGNVVCQDAFFSSKWARDNHPTPGTAIANNDKIVLAEWGSMQRLHSITYKRTVAWSTPAEQTDAEYFANVDSRHFTEGAVTAFPVFHLLAEDPNDASFTPILLATEAETTAATEATLYPLSALAYGMNTRQQPLLIVAQVAAQVPDECGLFLHCEFTQPHV